MKLTGPAHIVAQVEHAQRQDQYKAIARRVARRLIALYNVPDLYVDLACDPFVQPRPSLTETVARWVEKQSAEDGLDLRDIGTQTLQARFGEHLSRVFPDS